MEERVERLRSDLSDLGENERRALPPLTERPLREKCTDYRAWRLALILLGLFLLFRATLMSHLGGGLAQVRGSSPWRLSADSHDDSSDYLASSKKDGDGDLPRSSRGGYSFGGATLFMSDLTKDMGERVFDLSVNPAGLWSTSHCHKLASFFDPPEFQDLETACLKLREKYLRRTWSALAADPVIRREADAAFPLGHRLDNVASWSSWVGILQATAVRFFIGALLFYLLALFFRTAPQRRLFRRTGCCLALFGIAMAMSADILALLMQLSAQRFMKIMLESESFVIAIQQRGGNLSAKQFSAKSGLIFSLALYTLAALSLIAGSFLLDRCKHPPAMDTLRAMPGLGSLLNDDHTDTQPAARNAGTNTPANETDDERTKLLGKKDSIERETEAEEDVRRSRYP